MEFIKDKKLVLFGAGKIGRSFIGQLFSRGGYEVVFVDMDQFIVDQLNEKRSYKIVIKAEDEKTILIENVSAVHAADTKRVEEEVASAGIVGISVGPQAIEKVIPTIAKALLKRLEKSGMTPLDVILAENMRNAAEFFLDRIKPMLPGDYPVNQLLGLVETSIGKMVPVMRAADLKEDPLQVFAEPYNTLILDAKGFKNPIPQIEGLAPKEHMKAWVDRKLFVHNLGHVAVAYLGYVHDPGFTYLYEVLENQQIRQRVRETMLQGAEILLVKYPGEFTRESLDHHIDDLLDRFKNRYLGDTIYRVGCDLPRKLGIHDRLLGAIALAIEQDLPYDKILYVLVSGAFFRAEDEDGNRLPQDIRFEKQFNKMTDNALQCDMEELMESIGKACLDK